MKILLSQHVGFCSGVMRTLQRTMSYLQSGAHPVYVRGALIHNPQAQAMLEQRGLIPVESYDDIAEGFVIIPAHGLSPQERIRLRRRGLQLRDATCPRILTTQALIRKYSKQGFAVIIIGEAAHPEVQSLSGFAVEAVYTASSASEAAALPSQGKTLIVAQAAFPCSAVSELAKLIKESQPEAVFIDTTCPEIQIRYDEIKLRAPQSDYCIIVGGNDSSNTSRLAEIASPLAPTIRLEDSEGFELQTVKPVKKLAIGSGVSTPSWAIRSLLYRLGAATWLGHSRFSEISLRSLHWLSWTGSSTALMTLALTYFACIIQNIPPAPLLLLNAVLFVLFGFFYNRFIEAVVLNVELPRHKQNSRHSSWLFLFLAAGSAALSFVIASRINSALFWLMAGLFGAALLGLTPLLPAHFSRRAAVRRLIDYYTIKDVLAALAWSTAAVIAPLAGNGLQWHASVFPAFIIVFLMIVARMVLLDLKDSQLDLLTGKKTVPVMMGIEYTKNVIILIGVTWIMAILMAWPMHLAAPIIYGLLLSPMLLGCYILYHRRRIFAQGLFSGMLVDGVYCLSGAAIFVLNFLLNKG